MPKKKSKPKVCVWVMRWNEFPNNHPEIPKLGSMRWNEFPNNHPEIPKLGSWVSKCGRRISSIVLEKYKFCPYCGRKIVEGR